MKPKNKMKIIALPLVLVMLIAAVGVFSLVAFAADGGACATENCTGTYANGFCDVCGGFEAATQDAEGYYEIDNAGKLFWFAGQVNSGNNSINGKLTMDIDLNVGLTFKRKAVEKDGTAVVEGINVWRPIGNDDLRYAGIFDGNGHKVSGVYIYESSAELIGGLFGVIGEGATVKNLGIVNSSIYAWQVGGIAGHNHGTIAYCYNEGYVTCNSTYSAQAAGIAAWNWTTAETTHSYNSGEISAEPRNDYYDAAGVIGWNKGNINYCYNVGNVISTGSNAYYYGGVVGLNDRGAEMSYCYSSAEVECKNLPGGLFGMNRGTIKNCYHNQGKIWATGTTDSNFGGKATNVIGKPAEAFLSGEIAYLLNEDQSTLHFYQTCGEGTPAFSGQQVYAQYGNSCAISGYGNTYSEMINHRFENGICTLVQGQTHYEAPEVRGGTYEVKNAGNLFWLANAMRSGNYTVSIKLISDIDLAGYTWTPIPTFEGRFDGDYHVIKNLTISTNTSDDVGFFSWIKHHSSVYELGFENASVTNNGSGYTGILAGRAGQFVSIRNCYSVGSLVASSDKGGGLTGEIGSSSNISDCFTSASKIVASIASNVTLEKIYCAENTTAEIFASGAVAYALNGDQSNIRYYQRLGLEGDAYPGFIKRDDDLVFVSCNGTVASYTNSEADVNVNHAAAYTVADNVITQTCTAEGCHHYATARLDYPSQVVYSGAPVTPCQVSYSKYWFGAELPVTYQDNLNVGKALASIAIGNVVSTVNFEIQRKPLSFEVHTQYIEKGKELDPSKYTCTGLNEGQYISPTIQALDEGRFSLEFTVLDAQGNDVTHNYRISDDTYFGDYHEYDPAVILSENGQHRNVCIHDGCAEKINVTECDITDATCSQKAVCNVCKTEYGDVDPNVHTFGEWTVTKEATATENGIRTRTCVCGHTVSEEIPAIGNGADAAIIEKNGLPTGAIVGIAVGSAVIVGIVGFSIFWFVIKKKSWNELLHK